MALLYSKEHWTYNGSSWAITSRNSKIQDKSITLDYHARKAAGEFIPPTPYRVETLDSSEPFWTRKVYGNQSGNLLYQTSNSTGFGLTPWKAGHPIWEQNLRSKLLSKLQDTEVNVPLALLEADKAFYLVAGTLAKLRTGLRSVRRGDFRHAADTLGITLSQRKRKRLERRKRIIDKSFRDDGQLRLDQFSGNWLEYRYGWTPLLMDVYAAATIATDGLNHHKAETFSKDMIKLTVREKITDQKISETITSNPFLGSNTLSGEGSVADGVHSLVVWMKLIDELAVFKSQLGLNNPALVAWELIPFSFIADWFLPIGDAIKSYSAYAGYEFAYGYESWKEDITLKNGTFTFTNWKGSLETIDPSYWRTRSYRRTLLTGFDDLRVNVFSTPSGLNALRTMDAITLFQRFVSSESKLIERTARF